MANVFVIDAQPVVRLGIREIVERDRRHRVCGEATDARTAAAALAAMDGDARAEVIVADVAMEATAALLRSTFCSIPLVAFQSGRWRPAAAEAVVSKSHDAHELQRAIDAVLRGERYVLRDRDDALPHDALSPREREVLTMILAGARPKQIAHALGLSVKTISTHRFRIMRKLGVDGDVMLTRYAIRHALVSCE